MNIDVPILVRPPRTEFWIRKFYIPYVEDGSLTTVFRPGRRLLRENHPKGMAEGERIRICIVDQIGADWANLFGTLLSTPDRPALVISVDVKRLSEIEPDDFRGSTPDVMDLEGLKLQLAHICNFGREDLSPSFEITRTSFRYL